MYGKRNTVTRVPDPFWFLKGSAILFWLWSLGLTFYLGAFLSTTRNASARPDCFRLPGRRRDARRFLAGGFLLSRVNQPSPRLKKRNTAYSQIVLLLLYKSMYLLIPSQPACFLTPPHLADR